MTTDEVRERLEAAGHVVKATSRLGNNYGDQLVLKGAVVNVFDKGTIQIQGKDQTLISELETIIGVESASTPVRRGTEAASSNRDVFVVYGHDTAARTQLEAMLRRWRLDPLILDQLPSEGTTLIEKLEKYASDQVRFAVVLATPDDEGNVVGKPDERRKRARQNVVLELGLLLAKLGRPRVAILLKDQEHMERPSDLQGLIYLPFTDDVEEVKVTLAKEMHKQGIAIDLGKL
jgi:predicted nucleotide-binding protein